MSSGYAQRRPPPKPPRACSVAQFNDDAARGPLPSSALSSSSSAVSNHGFRPVRPQRLDLSSSASASSALSPRSTAPPGKLQPLKMPSSSSSPRPVRRVAPIPPPAKALPPKPTTVSPLASSASMTAIPSPSPTERVSFQAVGSTSGDALPVQARVGQRPVTMQPLKRKGSKRLPPPPIVKTSGASPAGSPAPAAQSPSPPTPVKVPADQPTTDALNLGTLASSPSTPTRIQSSASSVSTSTSQQNTATEGSSSSPGVRTLRRPPPRPTPPPAYRGAQPPHSPSCSPTIPPTSSDQDLPRVAPLSAASVRSVASPVDSDSAKRVTHKPTSKLEGKEKEVGALIDRLGTFIKRLESDSAIETQPGRSSASERQQVSAVTRHPPESVAESQHEPLKLASASTAKTDTTLPQHETSMRFGGTNSSELEKNGKQVASNRKLQADPAKIIDAPPDTEESETLTRRYRVLYDFNSSSDTELSVKAGWIILGGDTGNGWMEACHEGNFGFVPCQYVEEIEHEYSDDDYYSEDETLSPRKDNCNSSAASVNIAKAQFPSFAIPQVQQMPLPVPVPDIAVPPRSLNSSSPSESEKDPAHRDSTRTESPKPPRFPLVSLSRPSSTNSAAANEPNEPQADRTSASRGLESATPAASLASSASAPRSSMRPAPPPKPRATPPVVNSLSSSSSSSSRPSPPPKTYSPALLAGAVPSPISPRPIDYRHTMAPSPRAPPLRTTHSSESPTTTSPQAVTSLVPEKDRDSISETASKHSPLPSNITGSFHERMVYLLQRNMAGDKPDALKRPVSGDQDDEDDEAEMDSDAEPENGEERPTETPRQNVWMKALAAYNATEEGELTLKQGEVVLVHDYDPDDDSGWWDGQRKDGSKGLLPASHVALCDEEGNLNDEADATRFQSSDVVEDTNKRKAKKEIKRQRKELKRQEKELRRLEKKRSKQITTPHAVSGDTIMTIDGESGYVRTIKAYKSKAKDHLNFKKGNLIFVTDLREDENMLYGTIVDSKKKDKPKKSGWFPAFYAVVTDPPN